jgi:DNA-binding CsgD family transcriptional regulator/PAS domain-containing protein
VLVDLASMFNAAAASLISADKADGTLLLTAGHNIPDAMMREYRSRFFVVDPRVAYALPRRAGTLITDARVMTPAKMKRHPFYAEFLPRYGLREAIGCATINNETVFAGIGVNRGSRGAAFDEANERAFSAIIPHLRRAMQVAGNLQWARAHSEGLSQALDHVKTAVVIVDGNANVVGMNAAAEALLAKADGLAVKSGEFKALRPADNARLRRTIAGAAGTTAGGDFDAGGVLQIARRTGLRSYAVLVSPISSWASLTFALPRAGAIVMINDPEAEPAVPVEPLQRLYGLTAAEARLVAALAAGRRIEDAAKAFKISRETARTQLRQIFAKTGTTRQTDLVSTVLALPFGLPRRRRGA